MSLPDFEKMNKDIESLKIAVNNKVDKTLKSYSGDLNDVTTTGFVYAGGDAANSPLVGYSFYITTIALNANFISQTALRVASSTSNIQEYVRECYSGVWSEWKKIY